jgi:hypothetical protein
MSTNRSAKRQFTLVSGLTATCVLALGSISGTAEPVLSVAALPAGSTQRAVVSSTRVDVVVRPTVAVVLDSRGNPIRAISNTVRPPVATDTFTIYGNGRAPVPDVVIQAVVRMARSGDWTRPGIWHDLEPGLGFARSTPAHRDQKLSSLVLLMVPKLG